MSNDVTIGVVAGATIAIVVGLIWGPTRGGQSEPPISEIVVKEPALCGRSAEPAVGASVLNVGIRKQAVGDKYEAFVVPEADAQGAQWKCAVAAGSVVAWVPDTGLTDLRVKFVSAANADCATAKAERSIQSDMDEFVAGKLAGYLTPVTAQVTASETGDYFYCVSAVGPTVTNPVWTPKPSIIIKPK